ncbi:beta-N-acetylhexosaminidase [Saccharibacillus sp. O23]|uniref:beta-N-acetylhexosaminidase n=1 Tax=Saccharibacillus sp. O23 TaxID=2009338 RepID=UPI000B4E63A7|nr:beta-N-acetylhexosaminidase [Saccharibacillus sp. O23]OWR27379.1 beta-N-acetylhexosaminidase [Saccharibacillus sp. O23]
MPRTARSTRHSRKNRSNRKFTGTWFAVCGILLALIVAGIFLILNPSDRTSEPQSADSPAQQNATQNSAEQDPATSGAQDSAADETANASAADRVAAIAALAKQGKIEGSDFVVGLTREQEVESLWQAPKRTSQSGGSVYADYPAQDATVGYKKGIVVDLRSDRDDLQEIRYRDIVDKLGDADSVKSYRDNDVDQAILGYKLPNGYTLRWILSGPLPTSGASAAAGSGSGSKDENRDNPALDHLSLIGPVRTESAQAGDGGSAAGQTSPNAPSSSPSASPQAPAEPSTPDSETSTPNGAADDLLAGMTLDQKIGQMVIAGLEGTSLREADRALIRDYGVGGVIFYADNIRSAAQTKQFAAEVRAANPRGDLPLFVSVDQEGGRVARLKGVDKVPTAAAIGAKNDPAYARSIGEQLGEQLRSQGFNLDYAPVLDVNSNPDNPVIGDRSFGSDANRVSKIALPVMEGLESKQIIPVVKHFPGHGDTSVDSHIALPVVNKSLAQLEKLELIPFKKAIADGADVVMIAHILLPKLDGKYPSSMSKAVITDLLRGKLGFEGVVMTDDMTMGAIAENYGLGDAAVRSVQAGSDIVLVAHGADNAIETIRAIKKAVESGQISEQRIDESAARIVALKQKYLSAK